MLDDLERRPLNSRVPVDVAGRRCSPAAFPPIDRAEHLIFFVNVGNGGLRGRSRV